MAALHFQETGARSWINNFGGGSPVGQFFCFGNYGGTHFNFPLSATLAGTTIKQTYVWGTCSVTFVVLPDKTLDISGVVINQSSVAITNLDLNLCKIAFPGNAPLGTYPLLRDVWNALDPGFYAFDGSGSGITCYFAFSDLNVWPGKIHAGNRNWGNNALYADQATLQPGASVSFHFHLNFFTTLAEVASAQQNVNGIFASTFPQAYRVQNVSPIGQIFFVTGEGATGWSKDPTRWATNPRGWLGDPTINVFTAAGRAIFKQRMIAFCNQILFNAAPLSLRGFIVWDIEGEQYPIGATTYVGHPSWLAQLAPEMDAIATDLFRIFTNAGYQVGFALRQQKLVANPGNPAMAFYNTPWPTGSDSVQAQNDLADQVRYCQTRFGGAARLYYIDSNGGNEVNTYQRLGALFPNCLFAPECNFIVTRMYAYATAYQTGRPITGVRNGLATQARFTAVYPKAQSLINLADVADTSANETAVANSMVRGDVQMIRIWWRGGSEYNLLLRAEVQARSRGWTGGF
jgi:hypothetical protein